MFNLSYYNLKKLEQKLNDLIENYFYITKEIAQSQQKNIKRIIDIKTESNKIKKEIFETNNIIDKEFLEKELIKLINEVKTITIKTHIFLDIVNINYRAKHNPKLNESNFTFQNLFDDKILISIHPQSDVDILTKFLDFVFNDDSLNFYKKELINNFKTQKNTSVRMFCYKIFCCQKDNSKPNIMTAFTNEAFDEYKKRLSYLNN